MRSDKTQQLRIVYLTDRKKIAAALEEMRLMFGLDRRLEVQYLDGASAGDPDRWVWHSLRAGEVGR